MPRTIDEGFRTFLKSLTPSEPETTAAKRHRRSIEKCIKSNFGIKRFWRTGSFGNGTSISGYSDVDYMASIPTDSLHRQSSESLATLRRALSRRFPKTGVRTSCPAVIVPFGTDISETTEVTPADFIGTTDDFSVYHIPDCMNGWSNASPDAHNHYVREVDSKLSNKVRPLIRFIKAWKYFKNVPVSSFYLELRVAKYATQESSIVYSIDVKRVFELLDKVELARLQDPMGISGHVSPCRSESQLTEAKSKLSTARSRAIKARNAEATGDIREAFEWWDKLFDYRFPNYYR